jgi:spermidine/putrescine transport system ATP-binding protein
MIVFMTSILPLCALVDSMSSAETTSERPVILSLAALTKSFGNAIAVSNVSLDIPEGEFLTIVGPSGSGKSTLVRLLAGLDQPTEGKLMLRGRDITAIPANQRPTAMVFQSLALFDHQTVGQNIEFALKMKGVAPRKRYDRALELLRLVRLPEDYYTRSPKQCSGGERQRIALARAFASDPEILFFDEPLSAIDYRLRKTLEVELKELHQSTGRTFVYITHSLEEAMVMSDRIAIMQAGKIVQIGKPAEIYSNPANRFVASFMGEVNLLEVTDGRFADLDRAAPDARGRFAVLRPEALTPGSGSITVDLTVVQRLMLGSRTQLHLRAPSGAMLIAEVAGPAEMYHSGMSAPFGFSLNDIVWVQE